MNYCASVVEEAAPIGLKVQPSLQAAEAPTIRQTSDKAGQTEIRMEDRRLAVAAQGGCTDSFELLVGRFEKPLYHFLLGKTRNHHQAEDLLQDTFVIAYRKLGRYNPFYAFGTWVFTIANRLAISHYRKQKPLLEEYEFAVETNPGSEMMKEEWTQAVWTHAKRQLSKNQFTALQLFYRDGMSIDQVATVMDRKPNSVKVWLHRARKRLAQGFKS